MKKEVTKYAILTLNFQKNSCIMCFVAFEKTKIYRIEGIKSEYLIVSFNCFAGRTYDDQIV